MASEVVGTLPLSSMDRPRTDFDVTEGGIGRLLVTAASAPSIRASYVVLPEAAIAGTLDIIICLCAIDFENSQRHTLKKKLNSEHKKVYGTNKKLQESFQHNTKC